MKAFAQDGGGIKGYGQACIVERLHARTGFLDKVEVFPGTSIGAINAVFLANGGTPTELRSMFEDHASSIFGKRDLLDTLAGGLDELVRANFSQEPLRKVLVEIFGDKRLPDLERDVMIVAFDLATFDGVFLDRSDDWSVVDALLSSSAAPTYLPVHIIHEDLQGRATRRGRIRAMVDGGMIANNPSDKAINYMHDDLKVPLREISVFSLGAGATPYKPPEEVLLDAKKVLDWGVKDWLLGDPAALLLKVLFEGSVGAANRSAKSRLKGRFHRLQPILPEDVDLADYSKLNLLANVASQTDLEDTVAWMKIHGWAV